MPVFVCPHLKRERVEKKARIGSAWTRDVHRIDEKEKL